jgi:hypothetical protein
MSTEPDFKIIDHEDGWQECAACGCKSKGSPGQTALGQMGMAHHAGCPNYPLLMQSVRALVDRG